MSVNTLQSPKNSWIPVALFVFGCPFLRDDLQVSVCFFLTALAAVPILKKIHHRVVEPLPAIRGGFTTFESVNLQIAFKEDGSRVVCVRKKWQARLTKSELILCPAVIGATDYLVVPLLDIVESRLMEGHELRLKYLDRNGQAVDVLIRAKYPLDTMLKTMQAVSKQHHGVGF